MQRAERAHQRAETLAKLKVLHELEARRKAENEAALQNSSGTNEPLAVAADCLDSVEGADTVIDDDDDSVNVVHLEDGEDSERADDDVEDGGSNSSVGACDDGGGDDDVEDVR
eukprot:588018-Pleurochrysis_carterae.AAC.1